jgi:hypothetical protein
MRSDDRHAEGIALTEKIMDAVLPIVDGLETDLVIEAFAAAMASLLAGAQVDASGARLVLYRYADRIVDFANMIRD